MAGIDDGFGDDNIIPTGRGEDDDFGNVVRSQGLAASGEWRSGIKQLHRGGETAVKTSVSNLRVDGIGFGLVAVESDKGEILQGRVGQVRRECETSSSMQRERARGSLTVSTWPGSTSITLILVATSSLRRLSVKLRTAALLAQ